FWHILPEAAKASTISLYAFAALGGFFAMVPDFDLMLGQAFHRKWFSHSLFAGAVFAVFVYSLKAWLPKYLPQATRLTASPTFPYAAVLAFLAHTSHILTDALTDAGAPVFWPLSRKHYSATPVNSGNPFLNGAVIVLCLFATYHLAKAV
ncbi:MAG: metal-dependent hydrolase, partial [Thermoproteota archaeon]